MVETLNVTEHWRDSVMQVIDIRWTVHVGIKRTFSSKTEDPLATISLMVPMPRALIEEPPTPVTVLSAIRCNVIKSEWSGEIWVVHVLSSKKGNVYKERLVWREEVGKGTALTATRSNSSIFLLLLHQLTEAWSESWVASQAYSAVYVYSSYVSHVGPLVMGHLALTMHHMVWT